MKALTSALRNGGAARVAFADLSALPAEARSGLPRGVAIAVTLDPGIVSRIPEGPSREYADEYDRKNALLDELAGVAAEVLESSGHAAVAQVGEQTGFDGKTLSTRLPHKTVAARAGLGWIGKCALLVTPEYGSMVRLTSVLTDAPLQVGTPIDASRCGDCNGCVEACPAGACTGTNWSAGMPREEIFNAFACRRTARERQAQAGIDRTGCGICIAVCPHTRRHLESCGL